MGRERRRICWWLTATATARSQADEIAFANRTADPNDTDLEALGALRCNGDHQIDANDAIWSQLRVWVDANRNA